jgi:hypothetical protein
VVVQRDHPAPGFAYHAVASCAGVGALFR